MIALDKAEQAGKMRSILCLFEGVVTGAADGYARMTGRPALSLLHLGPGLANGLASPHLHLLLLRMAKHPLLQRLMATPALCAWTPRKRTYTCMQFHTYMW